MKYIHSPVNKYQRKVFKAGSLIVSAEAEMIKISVVLNWGQNGIIWQTSVDVTELRHQNLVLMTFNNLNLTT